MTLLDRFDAFAASLGSRQFALATVRVSMGGLLFWWGLVKALNTGVGQAVSENWYGGAFSIDLLLIVFGWGQVVAGIALALGLFRAVLLPAQLIINVFVAVMVWQAFIDPFWLWMPGEKPNPALQLLYPSLIITVVSWLLIAFRGDDRWAPDHVVGPPQPRLQN